MFMFCWMNCCMVLLALVLISYQVLYSLTGMFMLMYVLVFPCKCYLKRKPIINYVKLTWFFGYQNMSLICFDISTDNCLLTGSHYCYYWWTCTWSQGNLQLYCTWSEIWKGKDDHAQFPSYKLNLLLQLCRLLFVPYSHVMKFPYWFWHL